MAKAIFNVFFKVIQSVLNIILLPINALIVNLFPDFSSMITTFNTAIRTYIGPTIGYFSSLLPPTTKTLLIIYLTFLISYYTISYSAHAIIKIFKIIQKIKFW